MAGASMTCCILLLTWWTERSITDRSLGLKMLQFMPNTATMDARFLRTLDDPHVEGKLLQAEITDISVKFRFSNENVVHSHDSIAPYEKQGVSNLSGISKYDEDSNDLDVHENDKQNSLDAVSQSVLPWWEQDGQRCEAVQDFVKIHPLRNNFRGHCGIRASKNKAKQKVISYTVYGNVTNYLQGFHLILRDVGQLYPGWLVRLYTDPRSHYEYFCPLMREFPYFFICDTKVLSEVLHVDEKMNSMMWRTAPFGDKQVERFLVRDIDSKLSSRERVAVQVWERSGRLLHLMRDHPDHNALIMGGMYGVRQTPRHIHMFKHIRLKLFSPSRFVDQILLENAFPAELIRNSVQHMSYNCWWFKGTQPFPTQRQHGFFVGNPQYKPGYEHLTVTDTCPEKCRPPEHQDWVYC